MQPVRIKVYGLVSLTRRTYLLLQAVGVAVLSTLLAVGLCLPRPASLADDAPVLAGLLDVLPWLVGLILLLEGIETYFVLRRFAHQEALRQAKPPDKAAR
jgi:hypothetical protein